MRYSYAAYNESFMGIRQLTVVSVLGVQIAACYREPARHKPASERIHQEDLDAWRGAPLIELETHPVFSRLPLEKRKLSDGSEMWLALECVEEKVPLECSSVRGLLTVDTKCNGGDIDRYCCQNQFHIIGDKVDWWRPNGKWCATKPALRPRPASAVSAPASEQ